MEGGGVLVEVLRISGALSIHGGIAIWKIAGFSPNVC